MISEKFQLSHINSKAHVQMIIARGYNIVQGRLIFIESGARNLESDNNIIGLFLGISASSLV